MPGAVGRRASVLNGICVLKPWLSVIVTSASVAEEVQQALSELELGRLGGAVVGVYAALHVESAT